MEDTAIQPVIKSVRVGIPIEDAFHLFTRGMGEWWPLETHSVAADTHEGKTRATSLVFEAQEGGRIYEVMSDGSQGSWGQVLDWEPPHRVTFSWKPNLLDEPHTEVEVRFRSAGDHTELVLEHRGWERLGSAGIDKRRSYDSGWPRVLELFKAAA